MRLRHLILAATIATAALPVLWLHAEEDTPSKPTIDDLAWMAGTWRADGGPMPFEEHWTAPWGGTMAAVSRGLKDGAVSLVELSSIEEVGNDLVLHLRHFHGALKPWAAEKDGPLTWTLSESTEKRVVFTDPEQHFPRSVTYERDGNMLRAILEGGTDEKPMRMAFELKRVE
jgi:hypothetical protein